MVPVVLTPLGKENKFFPFFTAFQDVVRLSATANLSTLLFSGYITGAVMWGFIDNFVRSRKTQFNLDFCAFGLQLMWID